MGMEGGSMGMKGGSMGMKEGSMGMKGEGPWASRGGSMGMKGGVHAFWLILYKTVVLADAELLSTHLWYWHMLDVSIPISDTGTC